LAGDRFLVAFQFLKKDSLMGGVFINQESILTLLYDYIALI